MKKQICQNANPQSGQTTILVALMVCVLVPLIASITTNMNFNYSQTYARTQNLLKGLTATQGFSTLVERGFDLYQQAQYTVPGSGCPSGTQAWTGTTTFCLPPPSPPICVNGYCLSGTSTASREKIGTEMEARLPKPEESKIAHWFHSLNLTAEMGSYAYAQRVIQRPSLPAVVPTNGAPPYPCPGGGPLCRACDGVSLHCITLQVCPLQYPATCTTNQYWVQRYGILLN